MRGGGAHLSRTPHTLTPGIIHFKPGRVFISRFLCFHSVLTRFCMLELSVWVSDTASNYASKRNRRSSPVYCHIAYGKNERELRGTRLCMPGNLADVYVVRHPLVLITVARLADEGRVLTDRALFDRRRVDHASERLLGTTPSTQQLLDCFSRIKGSEGSEIRVLDLRTTTWHKCEAVSRRPRI